MVGMSASHYYPSQQPLKRMRNNNNNNSAASSRSSLVSLSTLFLCLMCSILSFYTGMLIGSQASGTVTQSNSNNNIPLANTNNNNKLSPEQEQARITDLVDKLLHEADGKITNRFPSAVSEFAVGMSRVNRDEFAKRFDTGVPLDESKADSNNEVLIIYQNARALPKNALLAKEASSLTEPPLLQVDDATENCDVVAVALLDHSRKHQQCIALMGQYESWHLQKFMRMPEGKGKLDMSLPLRYVNRGAQASGRVGNTAPSLETTKVYWEILQRYLAAFEENIKKLEPIVQPIAIQNTVIVMVCNFGQSELLMNFICHAKRRNLDLSNVLIFATDEETRDLVASMNIAVFYDEYNYENMPKEAAKRYADRTFRSMMLSKVFCVQMVLSLGYDVLFQDVDMVWFRNPLDYFHDKNNPSDFDMYFQDDGNHASFYSPYSANTGFYYVRNNDVTKYFFNSFLMTGDTIIANKSHQIALIALLSEHASLHGLKVKIFSSKSDDFPGGHAFHQRKSYMKDFFAHVVHPYIFHMSWTNNKVNKQKFFQQMGEWYFEPTCIQQTVDLLTINGKSMFDKCCLNEPIIACHYRDKPSIHPCKDSPPIDAGQRSWW